MTVRTKQELIAQAAVLFPDAGDPLIQASELRSFLADMADSFAFMSEVTGAMVVQLINTQLGQTDWQNATVGGSGITLAQALAALQVDQTPVGHLRVSLDKTLTQATYGLESVAAHTMTRYAAVLPVVGVPSEADWLAGNTSTVEEIEFPATTAQHKKGFAIPASETSLTVIQQVGNPFDERGSYLPAVGDADILVDIGGESHKTYIGSYPEIRGRGRHVRTEVAMLKLARDHPIKFWLGAWILATLIGMGLGAVATGAIAQTSPCQASTNGAVGGIPCQRLPGRFYAPGAGTGVESEAILATGTAGRYDLPARRWHVGGPCRGSRWRACDGRLEHGDPNADADA